MRPGKYLIVVLGPTAVGKTTLAMELAKEFSTEIISADSRQFYKELTIGTAKPSTKELASVVHHFINSHSITERYNVAQFEKDALEILGKVFLTKDLAIMVGGSGLYINAVCNGFDQVPEANETIRAELESLYKEKGLTHLQELLKKHDAAYYQKVDIKNPYRLMRAIEVCIVTGKKYSELRTGQKRQRPFRVIKIGLTISREKLYANINSRVDSMVEQGLFDEVEKLLPNKTAQSMQTVGYSEIVSFFENKMEKEKAIELIKQHTRNYAKRQLTWFKKDREIAWFAPHQLAEIKKYLEDIPD